jgi:hypothetical protein
MTSYQISTNNQNNEFSSKINKYEILKKLLKKTFDNKLLILEENTENQRNTIQEGLKITNQVISTCINLSWIYKPKLEERRRFSTNKLSKNPLNSPSKNLNMSIKKKNYSVKKIASKNPKNNISSFNVKKIIDNKKKKIKNNFDDNSINKSNNNNLKLKELKILRNSKTEGNLLKNTQREKNIKNTTNKKEDRISKFNENSINNKKDKNINDQNKKINNNNNNNNTNEPNSNNKENKKEIINMKEKEKEIDNLIKESGIFKESDSNLLTPLTDLDFIQQSLLTDINDIYSSKLSVLGKFNKIEFIETNLHYLIKFLNISDITNIVLVNHVFRNNVYNEIINNLENERQKFMDFISFIPENEIIPKYNKNNVELSKSGIKAIKLLNEPILIKIFNDSQYPINDNILLIYRIYFQLINHPLSKEIKYDKRTFWNKICNYFINENKGKIGDLLEKNYKENLDLRSENIYKILHIIQGKIDKITPSYFSKICGTTALFSFFIKDILEFLGISNDKKIQLRAYWTYKDLIDLLEKRIETMKNFMFK